MSMLAFLLLLCLQAPHAAAATADPTPTPTPWPQQFHATLLMDYGGNLSVVDLWYDWPRGLNLEVIRYQLAAAADTPTYNAEWNNGTSFFYTPGRRACRSVQVSVGILRPGWLAPGATYLGRAPAGGFDCHVWSKYDFVTYYEDVSTGRPVKWVFYTGRTHHVMSFEPGAVLEDVECQTPAYCFAKEGDGTAKSTLISEPDLHDDDGSFITKFRMLRGG